MRRVILCVVVALFADTGRADFILSGSEHREVDSIHDVGILYDSSTADVVLGGHISNAYVNNASSLVVFAGGAGDLYAYNTSSVDISGGRISTLHSNDSSSVDISSGVIHELYPRDTSIVNISGGEIPHLQTYSTSSVDISGGDILQLYAQDTSSVDISGGGISMLWAYQASNVTFSGGGISTLRTYHTSSVTFQGYDFRATAGLRLEDELVLGTGVLSGKWFDGTPWIVNISRNDASATIRAVPEPSTLTLLAMGAAGLLAYAWRRRKGHAGSPLQQR